MARTASHPTTLGVPCQIGPSVTKGARLSELGITKSGVLVGQAQVEIGMGSQSKPALADGAVLKAVEPRDLGELVNEVRPVLDTVKQALLRVEEITRDVQTTIQTGGRALGQVEQVTRELPP